MSKWKDEKDLVLVAVIISIFTLVVLEPIVGIILTMFGLAYLVMINAGDQYAYQFSSTWEEMGKTLLIIGIAFAVFLLFGGQLISWATGQPFHIFSSIQLMSDQVVIPLTINMPEIQFLLWGIIIPFLETVFILGVVLKLLTRKFNIEGFDYGSSRHWFVVIFIGAVGSLFHLLSHQVQDPALLIDWLFFSVSGIVVMYQNELKGSGILHTIINMAQLLI